MSPSASTAPTTPSSGYRPSTSRVTVQSRSTGPPWRSSTTAPIPRRSPLPIPAAVAAATEEVGPPDETCRVYDVRRTLSNQVDHWQRRHPTLEAVSSDAVSASLLADMESIGSAGLVEETHSAAMRLAALIASVAGIGESRDDIVGVVHLRRAIGVPFDRRPEVPVAALMVETPRVPETVRLGPLLVELRDLGLQMAVVVDEYGGTSGVVTLEDVIEELVGDVADEHDRRRASTTRSADGSWLLPGVLRPDELAEVTGLQVPDDGPYETLGGLLMSELGRIPTTGDEIVVGRVILQVEAMAGRRVERVRVREVEIDGEDES